MQKNRILLQLSNIEDQLSVLSEKLYNPQLTSSEVKELSKKKKKLKKDMSKLKKRLDHSNE
jgi:regulator of replication initiation timing|tara:strand:+ start:168 stop:350 length:183 start_codon:yes stop_codon:yes gene_type:complete